MNEQNTYLPSDLLATKDMLLVAMLNLAGVPIETVENGERLFSVQEQLNREVKQLKRMLSVPLPTEDR